MASIGSLTGSTSSGSIYGNRNSNIISGLASGLDTESMIEGMVQGYQQKISGLEQNRTVLQWQQQAVPEHFQQTGGIRTEICLLYLQHKPAQLQLFQQCGGDHPKWDVFPIW